MPCWYRLGVLPGLRTSYQRTPGPVSTVSPDCMVQDNRFVVAKVAVGGAEH